MVLERAEVFAELIAVETYGESLARLSAGGTGNASFEGESVMSWRGAISGFRTVFLPAFAWSRAILAIHRSRTPVVTVMVGAVGAL